MSRLSSGVEGCSAARLAAAILAIFFWGYSAQSIALTDAQRTAAATTTATSNSFCTALPQFYWEIGDRNGKLASGARGASPPTATTSMNVYSAGKWVWGAYVYQRLGGQLAANDLQLVRMKSVYTANAQCLIYTTVQSCFNSISAQDTDPAHADNFAYGSAHFQKEAVDFGLGPLTKTTLATEIHNKLGTDFVFTYDAPQIAGRGVSTASDYAKFQRKMLNGNLLLSGSALGSNPACTFTDPSDPLTGRMHCDKATYSPADDPAAELQEAWHYSIGHWVEDDPVWLANGGDAAYSSPGAAGFYPWIDSSRTYYGVLARNLVGAASSGRSVKCGRLIRKAWLTGTAQ